MALILWVALIVLLVANPMVKISPIEKNDYVQWLPLWDDNNLGHSNPAVTKETWNRLTTSIYPVHGLTAYLDDKMVGFVHYILHPVTGHIDPVCYMQDVYVAPEHRRKGIARALVNELSKIGKAENWARIYWLAEESNEAAQRLYKDMGVKLDFSLHVLPL